MAIVYIVYNDSLLFPPLPMQNNSDHYSGECEIALTQLLKSTPMDDDRPCFNYKDVQNACYK